MWSLSLNLCKLLDNKKGKDYGTLEAKLGWNKPNYYIWKIVHWI